MHHTSAFSLSIAQATELDVTAVFDGTITVQNGHLLPPVDMPIRYIAAMSVNLQRARIVTPTLRVPSTPYIRPIMRAVVPNDPQRFAMYLDNPLMLKAMEEFQILAVQGGAAAEVVTAIVGLGVDNRPAPQGNIISMRGTSTTAAVANAWTQVNVTWQDTIPAGVYAVVGLEHQSTTGKGARLNILNQYWKPGCVSTPGIGDFGNEIFRRGQLGEWGRFNANYLPVPEVLCNAADASHEFYLYFVRVAGGVQMG